MRRVDTLGLAFIACEAQHRLRDFVLAIGR
jgi:hypothetical protein